MQFKRARRTEGYLSELLAGGERPFRYRSGVHRLLGMPRAEDRAIVFAAPLPPGRFAYGTGFSAQTFKAPHSSSPSVQRAYEDSTGHPRSKDGELVEVPREGHKTHQGDDRYPPSMPAQGPRHAPNQVEGKDTTRKEVSRKKEHHDRSLTAEREKSEAMPLAEPSAMPDGHSASSHPVLESLMQSGKTLSPTPLKRQEQNEGGAIRREASGGKKRTEEDSPPHPALRSSEVATSSSVGSGVSSAAKVTAQQHVPEGSYQKPVSLPSAQDMASKARSERYGAPAGGAEQLERLRRVMRGSVHEAPVSEARPSHSANAAPEVEEVHEASGRPAASPPVVVVQSAPAPNRPVPKAFWQTSVLRSTHLRSLR